MTSEWQCGTAGFCNSYIIIIIINIDNQESISKFLWDIINIHVNSGSEC